MSDFQQTGPITTLHLLCEHDQMKMEKQIKEASESRPIALVLPCLVSEMDGPALKVIVSVLESIDYLHEIVVTLGPASSDDFARSCAFFKPLVRKNRKVRLIWNDGERLSCLYDEIEQAGLPSGAGGKGKSAWMAYGYIVANRESYIIALHDCDILSYTRSLLNRLVFPTVMPSFDYEFCKGYYSRVSDRMNGRATRLLIAPLLKALVKILGPIPLLDYFSSFRYPLPGEILPLGSTAVASAIIRPAPPTALAPR